MNGHEKLTQTLFKIANAVNTTENLNDLFASIHESLNSIIDATNFYIALYDREEDKISFPYCVDQADGRFEDVTSATSSGSLTSKVIQSGLPCFFKKEEMIARAAGINPDVGTPAEQWLGVPLKTKGDIIGAVVIQSYNDPDIYNKEDMALLIAVSDQVALAIERKRVEDAEAKSKAVNKILFSISNAVNTTTDLPDLYKSIHQSLGQIIDLTNFIIGLWNKNHNTITFEYYIDQFDDLQGRSMTLEKGSVGRDVLLSGKAVFLKEKDLKKRIVKNQAVGTWPRVWMGVPLTVEGDVIGYMAAQSFDNADIFSEDDLEILSSVSEQVALAIDRKRSHEELKQSEKLTQALLKISNAVNITENLRDLYASIHSALKGVIDVTNFAIGIYDKARDLMTYPYYMDETGDVYHEIRDVSRSNILAGEVIQQKRPIFITREGMTHRAENKGKALVGRASEQWLGVPLRLKNEAIGVIVVQSYEDPERYQQKDADVLLSVSDQIALAIDRKRVQEEIRQSEKLTRALFNISNAVNTTDNMNDLYESIFSSLNQIIPLPNFLICVVDEKKELIHFPFFIDEFDTGDSVPVTIAYRDAAHTITAEVLRTKQPQFYTEEMLKQRAEKGMTSGAVSVIWLGVPLMIGDKVLGVMAVQHYTDPEYFTHKEMDLLMAVSDQVALALDRKQAQENIRKSENLTRALYKISNAVNTTENLNELYQAIYSTLNQLKPLPNFIISILDDEQKIVSFPLFIDEYDKASRPGVVPFDEESPSLTLEVIKTKKTMFLNQIQLEKRHQKHKPLGHSAVVWLGVPLIVREKVIGVMVVQHYSDPSYFVPDDIDVFVSVSDQIALAIDRKQSQDIILKHKENLEQTVRERTEELRKTCTAVEVSEKRFREMAELLPQTVFELDLEGRITYTNRHGLEISGYSMDEYKKGIDVFELVEPTLRERVRQGMENALLKGRVVQSEFMLKKKNGTMVPVSLYSNVILEEEMPVGFRGVLLDLTKRKKTEELMIQTEKMMSVGGLAAGMAHEINNPLAGMIQSGQVLKNRLTKSLPANEAVLSELGISMDSITAYIEKRGILSHLNNISSAGQRAAKIIENMLGFVRKSNSDKQNHPMDEILETSLELARNDYDLKRKYDFKHIKITRRYARDLPPVYCERSKIQQVVFNILKNASQAMATMEKMPEKCELFLGLSLEKEMVKIEIRDNGPGMDHDTRKKVFEPFFTTKELGEGTGLGLSVSYFIIVDDHSGEMEVASTLGKGTSFIIRLPLGIDS